MQFSYDNIYETKNMKKECDFFNTKHKKVRIIPFFAFFAFLSAFYPLSHYKSDKDDFVSFASDSNFHVAHNPPINTQFVLRGKSIDIAIDEDKDAKAYFVKSSTGSSKKYLILFHEWWGLNDHIKHTADAFSDSLSEINVIALDLYDGLTADKPDKASQIMTSISQERVQRIIKGILQFCSDDAQISTIGWCFGGGWSLQTALEHPDQIRACIMYYGMPEQDTSRLAKLNAPLLGIFAQQDKWITPDMVRSFEKRLNGLGKKAHIKLYDSKHAFANPSNPNYEKRSAIDASQIVLRFIRVHLDIL